MTDPITTAASQEQAERLRVQVDLLTAAVEARRRTIAALQARQEQAQQPALCWHVRIDGGPWQPAQAAVVDGVTETADQTLARIKAHIEAGKTPRMELRQQPSIRAEFIGQHISRTVSTVRSMVAESDERGADVIAEHVRAAMAHLVKMAEAAQVQPSSGEVWIQPDHLQKARVAPFLCRVSPTQDAPDFVPLCVAIKPEPMTPDRTGIYVWAEGTCFALVLVNKRPSAHAPGGQFNGHIIDSVRFYDGCPVSDWGGGSWTLLRDFSGGSTSTKGP